MSTTLAVCAKTSGKHNVSKPLDKPPNSPFFLAQKTSGFYWSAPAVQLDDWVVSHEVDSEIYNHAAWQDEFPKLCIWHQNSRWHIEMLQ